MSPWIILGWLLVVAVSIWILMILVTLSIFAFRVFEVQERFTYWRLYRKTRHIAPAEGQVWFKRDPGLNFSCGLNLHIERVSANGDVSIRVGATRWTETAEEWKQFVHAQKRSLLP